MNTGVFSTMTERRFRDNPRLSGVHIIGLDMGYSGPKCVHEKGNFVFPNYCQKISGELFGELSKDDIIYEDLVTGEMYAVGSLAMKSLNVGAVVAEDALFGRNHYLHNDFKICLRTALGLAMWDFAALSDGSDVFIQTGLPPAYKSVDEKYLRMAIEQEHHFAVRNGKERKEFHLTIGPEQVDVMYQPMGTFWSACYANNGTLTSSAISLSRSNLMVFDGGFGTLDKFFVRGKQLESKNTEPNLGMRRVLEETRQLIQKDLGVDISIPAMQECLKKGKIQAMDHVNLRVDEYPIDKYLMEANEKVCKEAFESIKDYVFDIRYLIMTGGTGAAWYDYFKERLKGVTTLEVLPGNKVPGTDEVTLPIVYANARGYYMYRYDALRRARK